MVPDSVVVPLIATALRAERSSWILDGFPRTITQARVLHTLVQPNIAVHLRIDVDRVVSQVGAMQCNDRSFVLMVAGSLSTRLPEVYIFVLHHDDITGGRSPSTAAQGAGFL